MKTLILSSSLSDESRSFVLCREIASRLKKEGVKTELADARDLNLRPHHKGQTEDMLKLSEQVKNCDNLIIGMGVHCYSVSDSLKIILDNCFAEAKGKFFGILCTAGGEKSYLATQHLSQICMNEWRMIQLPRILFATKNDFLEGQINHEEILVRMDLFVKEFVTIGRKLIG